MKSDAKTFSLPARILHWLMAAMILAMLFIGVGMVASVSERHEWLLRVHPAVQKLAAHASHWLLYILMLAMPLIGWAMLSAGGYPVMLSDSLRLPPIFPTSPVAFAVLRHMHSWFAMLLFLTFLAHMGAALYHGLIRRDGVLSSMVRGEKEAGEELYSLTQEAGTDDS